VKKLFLIFSIAIAVIAITIVLTREIRLRQSVAIVKLSSLMNEEPSRPMPLLVPQSEIRKPKLSRAKIESLIGTQDICSIVRAEDQIDNSTILEILSRSSDTLKYPPDENRAFDILFNNFAPSANWSNDQVSTGSPPFDFFNALHLSKLFYGEESDSSKPSKTDYENSMSLLRAVEKTEAGNSAPLIFVALIGAKTGDQADITRSKLIAAFSLDRFDTYVVSSAARIYEKGLADPVTHIFSTLDYARMPIPNYRAISELTLPFISSTDPLFAQATYDFENLLMKPAIQNKRMAEFIGWSTVESSVGKKSRRKLGKLCI